MYKVMNVVKVIFGSFLISVPSIILPLGWGFRSSVAQAQTIQYQLDEELNFESELKPITSNEFCDLDSTISNFQLAQLQGDFQKWPEVEDFLIDRMSKDLKKILEQIEQSSVYNFFNQFSDTLIENSFTTVFVGGQLKQVFDFQKFFVNTLVNVGVAFLLNQIIQPGQKKKLANLMNEAYDLGNYYYNLRQSDGAFKLFGISIGAASKLEKDLIRIRALNQTASIANDLKYYDVALVQYAQTLNISQEKGDGIETGNSLNKIGEIYEQKSNYKLALEIFQKALQAVREPNQTRITLEEDEDKNIQLNEKVVEGEIINNLGELYNQREKYNQAIDYSRQAIALAKEASDRKIEAKALNNLGVAYKNLGQFTEALEAHKQALNIYQEIADPAELAQTQTHLGSVYNSLGEYAQVAQLHQNAIATAQAINNPELQTNVFSNIGSFYNSIGQDDQALQYHQLALEIVREIENTFLEGRTLNDIGNIYTQQGKYDEALNFNQQVLALAEQSEIQQLEAVALSSIGRIQQEQGQWMEALESYQIALVLQQRLENRAGEAAILANLGEVYINRLSYDKALELLQQSLSIYQEAGDKAGEGFALNLIAYTYLKQGRYAEAEQTLWKALEVLEPLRTDLSDTQKISIFDTQVSTYSRLQQALIVQDKIETALEVSERGRARPLVELLSERYNQSTFTLPDIAKIQQIAKTQNATLVQYSILYEQVQLDGRVQSKESELYIWVIKPTGEVEFRQTNLRPLWQQKTSLSGLVQISRQSIGVERQALQFVENQESSIDSSTPQQNLQQLHQLLIEPIAELLPTDANERVIFIPQGELFLVPFPALKDAENKYLIQKHTILTAPAIQILELTQQQRQKVSGQDILIVGNPTMPTVPSQTNLSAEEITAQLSDTRGEQLSDLPGAETEAREIARIFQTAPLLKDDATKAAVLRKMPSSRIIHLATHGLLDNFGLGIPGAIALAPDTSIPENSTNNSNCLLKTKNLTDSDWVDLISYLANPPKKLLNLDGFLTSREIIDLKLNAELVVLSACSTGGGEITGDGVVGLSRAFIAAGVPSLIVSLWNVKDQPTAELMTAFYQNLQANPDKAQALRQAMLTLAEKYPEQPQFWAAFTLIGEAE
ncbi:MAG: CHAT domain-containing protein [Limnoraphis sp.]